MTEDSKQRTVLWIIEDNESAIVNMICLLSDYFPNFIVSDALDNSKTLSTKFKNRGQITILGPHDSAKALSELDFTNIIVLLDRKLSNHAQVDFLQWVCAFVKPKEHPVSVHIVWNSSSNISYEEYQFLTDRRNVSGISNQVSVSLVRNSDGSVFHLNKFIGSEKDKLDVLKKQGLLPQKSAIPPMQSKGLFLVSDKLTKRPVPAKPQTGNKNRASKAEKQKR